MKKIHFQQSPLKPFIFYANRFLHILQKKARNKLFEEAKDCYFFVKHIRLSSQ